MSKCAVGFSRCRVRVPGAHNRASERLMMCVLGSGVCSRRARTRLVLNALCLLWTAWVLSRNDKLKRLGCLCMHVLFIALHSRRREWNISEREWTKSRSVGEDKKKGKIFERPRVKLEANFFPTWLSLCFGTPCIKLYIPKGRSLKIQTTL